MKLAAAIANCLWGISNLPSFFDFRRALKRPAEMQLRLLRRLLARNAGCAYGNAHSFADIHNYEEFARSVPLVDYDDIAPWIERIRRGEERVLTSEPVTYLIPTSGSTAARKLIPFTAELQREFDRAIGPWITDLMRHHSAVLFGPAYWSVTPAMQSAQSESAAVPTGFADDASYLGGWKSLLVRMALIAPDALDRPLNTEEFRYRTLLCLLRQRELRLISVWHPSFLTLLLEALPVHWNNLLAEIQKTQRKRARELERCDPERPTSIWPRLRAISCWGDGAAEIAMADLRERFPNVVVQAKGLLATEAVVTIPFAGLHPVAVCSHFFEFIDERGRLRLVHELREKETYEVVVTTAGGLWRYRLGDRVQVTGFVNATPSLRFLGRNGNVSDLRGEKFSEAFVGQAIKETLARCATAPRFVLLAPDEDAAGWRYTLYLEGTASPGLAEALDTALRQNLHYAYCRDLGQLLLLRVFIVAERGYETFANRQMSQGMRLGEIKPTALSRLSGWSRLFSGKYVQEAVSLTPRFSGVGAEAGAVPRRTHPAKAGC